MYSNIIRLFHKRIALRLCAVFVVICFPTILLYAQNATSEYSPSCSTDPAAHRLFYSPTSNAQPGAVVHIAVGGLLLTDDTFELNQRELSYYTDAFRFVPSFRVGAFAFQQRVYIEAGTYYFSNYAARDYPIIARLQVKYYDNTTIAMSAGYHYFDSQSSVRKYKDNLPGDPIHWLYTNFTWNAGRNTYTVNAGITAEKNRDTQLSGTVGAAWYLSERWRFITDLAMIQSNPDGYGWLFAGFRYTTPTISVELASTLLIGFMATVGVTI